MWQAGRESSRACGKLELGQGESPARARVARDLAGWGALCGFITRCRGAAPKGQYALPPLAEMAQRWKLRAVEERKVGEDWRLRLLRG